MDESPESGEMPSRGLGHGLNGLSRGVEHGRGPRISTLDLTDPSALAELVLKERRRRRDLERKVQHLQENFTQLRDLMLAIAQQADDHEAKVEQKMRALRVAVDAVKRDFPGANYRISGLEGAVNALFELHDTNQPVIDNLQAMLHQLAPKQDDYDEGSEA